MSNRDRFLSLAVRAVALCLVATGLACSGAPSARDAGQDGVDGTGGGGTNGATGGAGSSGATGGAGSGGAIATGGSASGGHSASGGSGSGGLHGDGGVTGSGGSAGTGAGGKPGGSGTGGKAGASGTGGSSGGQTGSGGSGSGEFGFTYRSPSAMNLDWLCTFHGAAKDKNGHVQLVQTGTKSVGIATVPVYGAELAQLSLDGTVTALANAQYDWGGGHHNDTLGFDYQGQTYSYYHSSFGFGFRQCQPMDCLNVYAPGGTTPGTEGCTSARALPEVCVSIKAGGTHDPLVDKYMKCQGDTAK